MRGSASSIHSRRKAPWLRKHGDGVRLATCFLSIALAAEFLSPVSDANLIWLANGVLLSFVLLASRCRWPAYVATGFAALIAGSWCAIRGLGAFVHLPSHTPAEPSIGLQVFLGLGVLLLYSVSAVIKRKQDSIRQLEQIALLHALISENSRDAIILTDLSGQRTYSSSAAEGLGWKPEDLLTEGGLEMVHPEDRPSAQAIVSELKSGREEKHRRVCLGGGQPPGGTRYGNRHSVRVSEHRPGCLPTQTGRTEASGGLQRRRGHGRDG